VASRRRDEDLVDVHLVPSDGEPTVVADADDVGPLLVRLRSDAGASGPTGPVVCTGVSDDRSAVVVLDNDDDGVLAEHAMAAAPSQVLAVGADLVLVTYVVPGAGGPLNGPTT
jgi:hypothetical protein